MMDGPSAAAGMFWKIGRLSESACMPASTGRTSEGKCNGEAFFFDSLIELYIDEPHGYRGEGIPDLHASSLYTLHYRAEKSMD